MMEQYWKQATGDKKAVSSGELLTVEVKNEGEERISPGIM